MKIGNCRKILPEKIEFEYYIFNVFLIAAKCILILLCEFSTFFVQTWSDSRTSLILSWKPLKKILGKINTQRCSVTLKEYNWIFYSDKLPIFFLILNLTPRHACVWGSRSACFSGETSSRSKHVILIRKTKSNIKWASTRKFYQDICIRVNRRFH